MSLTTTTLVAPKKPLANPTVVQLTHKFIGENETCTSTVGKQELTNLTVVPRTPKDLLNMSTPTAHNRSRTHKLR